MNRNGGAAAAHIPELDGLRGVAVLLVLAFHFAVYFLEINGPLKNLRALFIPGWTGVDLFFILSGCLITGILLDEKGTSGYFRRFYIRRGLRIFPVYYLMLLIAFTVGRTWLLPPEGVAPVATLAYLTNFSNWLALPQTEVPALVHFWSLAVEEQFYLCWPLAVFWLDRKWLLRLLGCVIVIAPLVRFFILASPGDFEAMKRLASALTPARADGLAYGALVAIVLRDPVVCARLMRHSVASIAAVGGVLLVWFGLKSRFHLESAATLAALYSMLGIGYGLIVLQAVRRTGESDAMQRVLRMRVLRQAGRYSYGAYVFHLPVLAMTEGLFLKLSPELRELAVIPWFLGTFAITFGLAWLSWRFIESPILKKKDVWAPAPSRTHAIRQAA